MVKWGCLGAFMSPKHTNTLLYQHNKGLDHMTSVQERWKCLLSVCDHVTWWYDDITPPLCQTWCNYITLMRPWQVKLKSPLTKNLFVHIKKVRRKILWEQNLPSKIDMEKNMKVNISHHHVSPTPRIDLEKVNVFFVNLLVKMSTTFSAYGKDCNDITWSCTKLLM